jgi:hypothetical protein
MQRVHPNVSLVEYPTTYMMGTLTYALTIRSVNRSAKPFAMPHPLSANPDCAGVRVLERLLGCDLHCLQCSTGSIGPQPL